MFRNLVNTKPATVPASRIQAAAKSDWARTVESHDVAWANLQNARTDAEFEAAKALVARLQN